MTKTELIHAWFDQLWNQSVESTIDEILAADMVAHGLGPDDVVGRKGFHEFYRSFRAAFPDVRVNVLHVLESGDYATCQVDVECVAADGRGPFRFSGTSTVRIRNGQFVEGWNNYDFLSLLIGLGAVPANVMEAALGAAAGRKMMNA